MWREQDDVAAPRRPSARSVITAVSGMLTALLVAVLVVLPAPYTIEGAGPTFDVLADTKDAKTLLTIDGAKTYDPSGQLRMTTVAVTHASSSYLSLGPVIRAWLSPAASTYPEIEAPADESTSIQKEWVTSQQLATVAALDQLGIEVPATIRLAGIDDSSKALGLLQVDDLVVSADGHPISTLSDLSRAVKAVRPGDPITLTVARQGTDVTATFDTIDDGAGDSLLGVWVDPTFDMPYDVNVDIHNVGGPSAGLVFSLAIVDLLTPQDELKGAEVAGTGTMDPDGTVGPIGGIALKMIGASRAGAQWFLAPESNCSEVVGHVPDGLRVVSVSTLDEAYHAIVAIGDGQADDLPTCS